jgi:hypothetical protein
MVVSETPNDLASSEELSVFHDLEISVSATETSSCRKGTRRVAAGFVGVGGAHPETVPTRPPSSA